MNLVAKELTDRIIGEINDLDLVVKKSSASVGADKKANSGPGFFFRFRSIEFAKFLFRP